MELYEYVLSHSERGECKCGLCCDRGDRPDPTGHTADVFFFQMKAINEPDPRVLKDLIRSHVGVHREADLLDGGEHSYLEVGGWIGDQGAALLLVGLGQLLGLWEILTPNLLPGLDDTMRQQMAGMGMVSIRPSKETRAELRATLADVR